MIFLVPDKQKLDLENFYKTCEQWLRNDYYYRAREWQYRNLPRRIMVEEFLGGGPIPPVHYGMHCFNGDPRMIRVYEDRYTPLEKKYWYDMSWNPRGFSSDSIAASERPKPRRLDEMIEASRKFSEGFDYVRVDLYALPDRIVFGEMTLTEGAGLIQYEPGLAELLGSYW